MSLEFEISQAKYKAARAKLNLEYRLQVAIHNLIYLRQKLGPQLPREVRAGKEAFEAAIRTIERYQDAVPLNLEQKPKPASGANFIFIRE